MRFAQHEAPVIILPTKIQLPLSLVGLQVLYNNLAALPKDAANLELPLDIKRLFKHAPSRLFRRRCYKKLHQIVLTAHNDEDDEGDCKAMF